MPKCAICKQEIKDVRDIAGELNSAPICSTCYPNIFKTYESNKHVTLEHLKECASYHDFKLIHYWNGFNDDYLLLDDNNNQRIKSQSLESIESYLVGFNDGLCENY